MNLRGDWDGALAAFDEARASFRLLFGQGLNEAEARDVLQKAGPLFSEAAYAAAELGDARQALALLEEGRTRLLALALKLDALSRRGEDPRLDDLRRRMREDERLYETAQGEEKAARIAALAARRAELAALIDAVDARAKSTAEGNIVSRVVDLIPPDGALVAPIVAEPGGKLIVVSRKGGEAHFSVEPVPRLTREHLEEILGARGGDGWLGAYSRSLRSDHVDEAWLEAVEKVGARLGPLLAQPLAAALTRHGIAPGSGAPVVVLPVGALGLLPLGLAQHPYTGRYLMSKDYTISLAPSLQALAAAATARPPLRGRRQRSRSSSPIRRPTCVSRLTRASWSRATSTADADASSAGRPPRTPLCCRPSGA